MVESPALHLECINTSPFNTALFNGACCASVAADVLEQCWNNRTYKWSDLVRWKHETRL